MERNRKRTSINLKIKPVKIKQAVIQLKSWNVWDKKGIDDVGSGLAI